MKLVTRNARAITPRIAAVVPPRIPVRYKTPTNNAARVRRMRSREPMFFVMTVLVGRRENNTCGDSWRIGAGEKGPFSGPVYTKHNLPTLPFDPYL
jgi:hypothetical protein